MKSSENNQPSLHLGFRIMQRHMLMRKSKLVTSNQFYKSDFIVECDKANKRSSPTNN